MKAKDSIQVNKEFIMTITKLNIWLFFLIVFASLSIVANAATYKLNTISLSKSLVENNDVSKKIEFVKGPFN